jgi:D-glycero-alpha-D-manno-heptose-7-phosphate kinase
MGDARSAARADRRDAIARTLTARAPTRIDFGGGWTDVPPYSEERGGCVCNLAIARHATARIVAQASSTPPLDAAIAVTATADGALARAALMRSGLAGRVSLSLASDFPFGAGLGGSSAAGVAALAALGAWRGDGEPARAELAEESRRVEVEDLGVAGGRQDHYAAAFGGALGLHFSADGVRVERIAMERATVAAIERRLVVVYSGQSRISGETITAVLDAYRRRDAKVVQALDAMRGLARRMIAALGAGALDELGALVGEHWRWQRALHPAITTPRIEAIVDHATRAGALGVKALGASGGGCVLVVAPDDGADRVREAVAPLGEVLDFRVDEDGVVVEMG